MNPEKQQIAEKFFESIYHQTTPEEAIKVANQLVSDDFKDHNPQFGNAPDKIGFLNTVEIITRAFEQHYQVIELFQEDNIYTAVWKVKATHKGDFAGIPVTGKEVYSGGITIHRIEEGKITAHWEYFDTMGIMMQLQQNDIR